MEKLPSRGRPAFTLLEVALIVAIIGMMLMMIIGYLVAPKQTGRLPPLPPTTPVPSDAAPTDVAPAPATPALRAGLPIPGSAGPSPTPTRTIELSPQSLTPFR